jgi:hypothetical protein
MATKTIEALKKANTIFISAQPDEVYFHWQVEIYLYQFAKHNIADRCYALFGYRDKPSTYVLELAKKYKHIILYKDERDTSISNLYTPSIRPHLLKKFFAEYPDLGKSVFYHDSDIFLVKLPKFEQLLNNNDHYVSDTISYIGYNYIYECQQRYAKKYPAIPSNDLITNMAKIAGISPDLIKQNENNSGGAQYLMKNIDAAFWQEVEIVCQTLYTYLSEYEQKYSISNGIQKWTADMWAVLWLVWKRGHKTIVHNELDFSWGVSSVAEYFRKPIFHLAGVTKKNLTGKFYKGDYNRKNVFTEYTNNKNLFDDIDPGNATYEYVKIIMEYIEGHPIKDTSRFLLNSKDAWSSIYSQDKKTKICKRPVWRSVDGDHIIFHNSNAWVLTKTKYENSLKPGSGGFLSTTANEPYENGWNIKCSIILLDNIESS